MKADKADQLLEKVTQMPRDDDVMALLKAFFRGYPIGRLRKLLYSDDSTVVEAGAFIMSELGADAEPLLVDTPMLLHHASFRVRIMALDCVLVCATPQDSSYLAEAVQLMRDPNETVRLFAINFLSRCADQQLEAARQGLEEEELKKHLSWLLTLSDDEESKRSVRERLFGSSKELRRFGAVAAIRMYNEESSLLEAAAEHPDREIREATVDRLKLLRRFG